MKKGNQLLLVYLTTIAFFLLLSHWGSRTVTVLAENTPLSRERTIVIDAGHGGVDGGATSCSGRLESAYNLDISLRLRDLLHFLGYNTVMIRTTDISVYTKGETIAQKKASDLKERVRVTEETQNALLISIHQNIFPDSSCTGAQVFYGKTSGSMELAQVMQSAFQRSLGSNRKCKKSSGIYLMDHIHCTGILIECGFLSNPAEDALLNSADYQRKLCCVVASAVSQYLSNT